MKSAKTYIVLFILLAFVLSACFFINISLGSVSIPNNAILGILTGAPSQEVAWKHIVLGYRLPKACTAMIVGSGLGISGLLMQTLFRNPLAGPFVLGISSGASLGVAIVTMGASVLGGGVLGFLTTRWSLAIAAILGSFLVLLIVLIVATRVKDIMAILIIGLMFGSISGALVNVLSYFSSSEALQEFVFWGFGALGNVPWQEILILSMVLLVGVLLAISCIKPLNTLLLGEHYAKSLGINIKKNRLYIIVATSLLAGSITAFVGPIAFIGLAIPHITRQIFDTSDHKVLLPAVFILGAVVMLICDSIAQLPSSDYTLPINAITALVGAPVVIWLLIKKRRMVF